MNSSIDLIYAQNKLVLFDPFFLFFYALNLSHLLLSVPAVTQVLLQTAMDEPSGERVLSCILLQH